MGIETAVGRYLDAQGVIDLDEEGVGGNTFLFAMPSDPDVAVMLNPTGGVGLDDQGSPYDEPSLQVMVRGNPHDPRSAQDLIKAIYEALVGLHRIKLDPGGTQEAYVVRVLALQSDPANLGRDDNERFQFSQNFTFHIHKTTANRT